MIEVYTKPGCNRCQLFKNSLRFYKLQYEEHVIGDTCSREDVLEKFPGVTNLPIVVVNGEVLSGNNASLVLEQYKEHFGSSLLNESENSGC